MASILPVIAWDYQFAPNAQKSRNYLYATGTLFKICEQPFFIPRPILQNIGITYRRVPVLSIGKDVFCDNSSFIDALQSLLEKSGKGLKRSPHDRAFEAWGYRSFWVALPAVPAEFVTSQLSEDRKDLFPVFARKDYGTLQSNALSELRSLMATIETDFLGHGEKWIAGNECGLADVHCMWMVKWALKTLKYEERAGFGKDAFPRIYQWIDGISHHDEDIEKDEKISQEVASKQILSSEYSLPEIGIDTADPLQVKANEDVAVEATDAEPGTHPQHGKLIGLSTEKCVLQLDNGIRVHFPRVGYIIRRPSEIVDGR